MGIFVGTAMAQQAQPQPRNLAEFQAQQPPAPAASPATPAAQTTATPATTIIRRTIIRRVAVPGPKGDKGDKGDVGPIGPKGLVGEHGVQGADGGIGPWSAAAITAAVLLSVASLIIVGLGLYYREPLRHRYYALYGGRPQVHVALHGVPYYPALTAGPTYHAAPGSTFIINNGSHSNVGNGLDFQPPPRELVGMLVIERQIEQAAPVADTSAATSAAPADTLPATTEAPPETETTAETAATDSDSKAATAN
jgi:hypothetical protein